MRAAVVVLLALVLTGCGVPTDAEPRTLDAAEAPFQVFSSTAPPAPSGDGRGARGIEGGPPPGGRPPAPGGGPRARARRAPAG
ncbi:MAG: hypothetical protein LH469_08260, partial [Frankiaceae bacterium]|nr:hypothetical protein [Frankiaceae bacterium]